MDKETLEELQADMESLNADDIGEAITDAASCETVVDFQSNLDNAIEATKLLLRDLKEIRKTARTIRQEVHGDPCN